MTSQQLRLAVFFVVILLWGCGKKTENQNDKTVKLANQISALSIGALTEIEGKTDAEEMYILFGAYLEETDFALLGIPENVQSELIEISRVNDHHSLARICGKKVVEYTYFYPSNDKLARTPVVIKGNPFNLKKTSSLNQILLTLENPGQ